MILRAPTAGERLLVGVSVGSGISATGAAQAGADLLMALSSGVFRRRGNPSLAGYLPYANSNELTLELLARELAPLDLDLPLVAGLHAADPTAGLNDFIERAVAAGASGINNYPTIGLVDGNFGAALAEEWPFEREVELIRRAAESGLLTVAFVVDEPSMRLMVEAGAQIICLNLGLTVGGLTGPARAMSLAHAARRADSVLGACERLNPQVIRMVYGGPVRTGADMSFIAALAPVHGYIGGSTFERLPYEEGMRSAVDAFHGAGQLPRTAESAPGNPVDAALAYVAEHYGRDCTMGRISELTHLSRSHFSTLFTEQIGIPFRDYVINYRMEIAARLLRDTDSSLRAIAHLVGYRDYPQFSRMFAKHHGRPPIKYREESRRLPPDTSA
ncbi:MAG: phosphoenolpyruvate hydrolase family protein [Flaviflexus sp.]|nr:phosphoenolpyruvate hydrolase family protein [Flaviflexus sp.]